LGSDLGLTCALLQQDSRSRLKLLALKVNYDKMIEPTALVSLFSLFWKNLEPHCFELFSYYFVGKSVRNQW